jgi:hypothetical protein
VVEFWRFIFRQNENHVHRLQIQKEVLRTVLLVSFVVALFFALRCYAFLYRPVIEHRFHAPPEPLVQTVVYPWFLYQFPEFFPNLFIALGISPPKGVMRMWKLTVTNWISCWYQYVCCVCICFCSRRAGNAGEDDSEERGVESPKSVSQSLPPAIRLSTDSQHSTFSHSMCSTDMDANGGEAHGFDFDPYRARREDNTPRTSVDVENPMWKQSKDDSQVGPARGSAAVASGVKKSASMFEFFKRILPGTSPAMGPLTWPTQHATGCDLDQGDDPVDNYVYSISGFNPSYDLDNNSPPTAGSMSDASFPSGHGAGDDEAGEQDWTENLDMFY